MHAARRSVCFLALNVYPVYVIFICTCYVRQFKSLYGSPSRQASSTIHSYWIFRNNCSAEDAENENVNSCFINERGRDIQTLFAMRRRLRWQYHVERHKLYDDLRDYALQGERLEYTWHTLELLCLPLRTKSNLSGKQTIKNLSKKYIHYAVMYVSTFITVYARIVFFKIVDSFGILIFDHDLQYILFRFNCGEISHISKNMIMNLILINTKY